MNNKEYLNEENYQKNSKKVNTVGSALLCIGLILILAGIIIIILALTMWNKPTLIAIGAPLIVFGFAFLSFGAQAKLFGNVRNVTAYMTQQQMPIVKESIEKMTPSSGTAAKEIAKEIAKGIKQGLKEADDENK